MSQQTINTPRDTTFKTTENTPRNLADTLADELSGIASAISNIGSDDYDDLTNKPQVNGVTLSGNKSSNDLSLAAQSDLTSIKATGTTNATGATISKGLYFYLNDELCQAKADIASGATFTLNTNYEVVTAGGLNSLNSALTNMGKYSTTEEVEIGTYNGSKLYRKVYSSTGTGARTVPFSGFNKNKIVKMTATLIYGVFASEPYYAAANDWWNYYVNDNNGSIFLRGAGSAINENSTFIVIVEYTK